MICFGLFKNDRFYNDFQKKIYKMQKEQPTMNVESFP